MVCLHRGDTNYQSKSCSYNKFNVSSVALISFSDYFLMIYLIIKKSLVKLML